MYQAWPSVKTVRELATQVKKAKKGREDESDFKPFVAADLRKSVSCVLWS